MKRVIGLAPVVALAGTAVAQPVVPARLVPGTLSDTFAPQSATPAATTSAWFVFIMNAAGPVDIDINRTAAPNDPFAALFAGDVTGVDVAASLSEANIVDQVFAGFEAGALTLVDFQDDTEDDAFGGPFGDPRFTRNLDAGVYSLYVTNLTPNEGGSVAITAAGVSSLVEPVALVGGEQGDYLAPHFFVNPASSGAWFTFTLPRRANLEIDVTRTTANNDPIMALYRGSVAGVDVTAVAPGTGSIASLVNDTGTFGPLTFVARADDTDEDPLGGPFGDPRITLQRVDAGTYSVVVANIDPIFGGTFVIDAFRINALPLMTGTRTGLFAANRGAPIAGTTWFTFTLPFAGSVNIDIDRETGEADLQATLWSGDADGLATQIGDAIDSFGVVEGDVFGPLTALEVQDDTDAPALPGPFGDPRFTRSLPAGTYSISVYSRDESTNPTDDGDFSVTATLSSGCSIADLSAEFGTLDINDILTFANLFNLQAPEADFFADGMFDINDILVFAGAFNAGCP